MILYLTTHFGWLIHFWALLVFSNRGHLQGPHIQVATFFFSYTIIAKFILSLSPQLLLSGLFMKHYCLRLRASWLFFPKENSRKIIYHFILSLTKDFSSQNEACPWGSLEIDNSEESMGAAFLMDEPFENSVAFFPWPFLKTDK